MEKERVREMNSEEGSLFVCIYLGKRTLYQKAEMEIMMNQQMFWSMNFNYHLDFSQPHSSNL